MGIFGKISEAIFGRPATPQGPARSTPTATGAAGESNWWLQAATNAQQQARQVAQQSAQPTARPVSDTDVAASLEARAAARGEKLNWRTSIVDLMKLLDIDSSLENRRELARELGYTGDAGDSATMNVWLHRQVMRELAANGGRVPAELTD